MKRQLTVRGQLLFSFPSCVWGLFGQEPQFSLRKICVNKIYYQEVMSMCRKIVNMIKEVLEKNGLPYKEMKENIIKVTSEDFYMGIETDGESMDIGVFSTEEVNAKQEMQMLRLLNLMNLGTGGGHWALDEEGTVCRRIAVDFEEDEICKEYIEYLILLTLMEQKLFGTAIKAVSLGISTADEAYREALRNLREMNGGK